MLRTAAFVDRDGTILQQETGSYLTDISQAHFEIGALDALVKLGERFDRVLVVTNQAGLATGEVSRDTVYGIHEWTKEAVERRGGHLDGLYICPHYKQAHCACRKPGVGLYEKAVADHQIDVSLSVGIGDGFGDIKACLEMRLHPVLVMTGTGKETAAALDALPPFTITVAADLYAYAYGLACKQIVYPAPGNS